MLVIPPPYLKFKCFEVILQPYTEYFEGCIWAWCTPSIPATFAVLSSRRERMQWYFLFWIWKLGANQKRNRRKEKYDKSERIQKNLWNRKFHVFAFSRLSEEKLLFLKFQTSLNAQFFFAICLCVFLFFIFNLALLLFGIRVRQQLNANWIERMAWKENHVFVRGCQDV